jgi:hypothetical protein
MARAVPTFSSPSIIARAGSLPLVAFCASCACCGGPTPAPAVGRGPTYGIAPAQRTLAILGTRPRGVLVGESAVTTTGAWERGGTWTFVSLSTGATQRVPSPLRLWGTNYSGRPPAVNLAIVGDVLVGHDETSALVIRGRDGATVRGEPSEESGILGAERVGGTAFVWWRRDARRTEIEAIDVATARRIWIATGPSWSRPTSFHANGTAVAAHEEKEVTILDATTGALIARRTLSGRVPIALAGSSLVVAGQRGITVLDPRTSVESSIGIGIDLGDPWWVIVEGGAGYGLWGGDSLVAFDLAAGRRRWTVRSLPSKPAGITSEHLVVCDGDGGATFIDRSTGAASLRIGVGGCFTAVALGDGTIAVGGSTEIWIVGPGSAAPRDAVVEGRVTLDGLPGAGLPVFLGVEGAPSTDSDGCPPLPPYAGCVLTDAQGRFRVLVQGLGLVPVHANTSAAARRARRPRAVGGSATIDLRAPILAPLVLDVRGERELL